MNTAFFSVISESLGWTLVHFLWQAAAIAAVLACVLWLQRRSGPNLRYLSACGGLGVMVLAAVTTFVWQWSSLSAAAPAISASAAADDLDLPAVDSESIAAPIVPIPIMLRVESIANNLRRFLPSIVVLWAMGVTILSTRLMVSWRSLRRLQLNCVDLDDAQWRECFERLSAHLKINSPVRLWQSGLATMPMVIGWVKPVVLIPAALVTGLTGPQLEAVLAHELAHVRRHDYLVNLLQNAIEIVFFYHPAVWWVSRRIRIEREYCCDDIAAAVAGGTLSYGRSLSVLEQLRPKQVALAMAAGGGSLVQRIRRLAGANPDSATSGWTVLSAVVAISLIAFVATAGHAGLAQEQPTDRRVRPDQTKTENAGQLAEDSARYTLVVKTKRVKPSRAVALIQRVLVDADGKPLPHGTILAADDRASAIFISGPSGPASPLQAIIELIKEIDGEPAEAVSKKSDSTARPETSEQLAIESDWTGPVAITRLPEANVIVMRGREKDVAGAKQLFEAPSSENKNKVDDTKKSAAAPGASRTERSQRLAIRDDTASNEPRTEILALEKQSAETVMLLLEDQFPQLNSKTAADAPQVYVVVGGKMLVVRARPQQLSEIRKVVDQLERRRVLRLYTLRRLRAEAALEAIEQMMRNGDQPKGGDAFRVSANAAANRLIINATEDEHADVWKLLRQLGETTEN